MIVALIALLFLGGGSVGMLEDINLAQGRIKVVMEKGDERKGAESVLKIMAKRTKSRNKIIKKIRKEISDSFSEYEGAGEGIEEVLEQYRDERTSYNNDMIDLRFELKQYISREDWAKVYP